MLRLSATPLRSVIAPARFDRIPGCYPTPGPQFAPNKIAKKSLTVSYLSSAEILS